MDSKPDIVQVHIDRDIDASTVDETRDTLDRLIEDGCRQILLDMSGVGRIDSAGIAMLLAEVRLMRSLHGLLTLTNACEQVLSLLMQARLVDSIPIAGATHAGELALSDPSDAPLWRSVVPVASDDLSSTRAEITRLFERSPLSQSELFDALLATGEALGNAVDHAKGENATATVISFSDRVIIEVRDDGPGFDVEEAAGAFDPASERGRGIRLMGLVADSVSIISRPSGHGTLVRIIKLASTVTD